MEDDADLRGLVAMSLGPTADVTGTTDLADARLLLSSQKDVPFDLVILDILLPDGSGLDLLPHLQPPSGRHISVVVYTSYSIGTDNTSHDVVAAMFTKSSISIERLAATVLELAVSEAPTREGNAACPPRHCVIFF